MAKDKISDYSSTANSNTDIAGINIDEGCAPSGINDAIRTLMAQLKTWQSGGQDVYIHPAGSASAPSITANGDTNTGIFFPAADTVGITTGGTERARVDSSGNVGVGVTPSAWLTSYSNKAIQVGPVGSIYSNSVNSSNKQMAISSNTYLDSGAATKYIADGHATAYLQYGGNHVFSSAVSGTAGGAVSFTDVLVMAKDKSIALQGASVQTGAGITFPATQSASSDANTLDDYEEGTWTPTSATGTITYTGATYTKIGKLVTIQVSITTFSDRSSTNAIQIGGMPFVPTTSRNVGSMFARYVTGTFCASYVDTSGFLGFYGAVSGNYAPLQHANLNNASAEIYFEISYFAS